MTGYEFMTETEPSKTKLEQGIRERKKPSNQVNQHNSENAESINQTFSNSLTSLTLIDVTNKITKIYKRQIIFGLIVVFIIFALIYAGRPSGSEQSSPFFQKFAGTTKSVFEEINNAELPVSDAIMQHTVSCRNVANMIQRSPAFGNHGSQIASGLRDFGDKITKAGRHLQNMYNKGTSVYKSFDIEIKAMTDRLKTARSQGDAKFFKSRINKLITNIQEFRKAVDKAQSSIHNAEEIRHDTEGYIIDGLREAEKFVANERNSQHAVDLSKGKKELEFVGNVLEQLHNTADQLDWIKKILMNYEDRLLEVEAALDNSGDDANDIFEVTNEDLSYLKHAVDSSKSCLYKFRSLSG